MSPREVSVLISETNFSMNC